MALDRQPSNVSCSRYHNGRQMLIDLRCARTWCHVVEGKVMRVCRDQIAAEES